MWCQSPRRASECLETSNGCRDARKCLAGGRPLCQSWTSNGCRDARSCVRCVKGYSVRGFNGNGRSTERPYNRYSSCRTTTDARPCVPTTVTRLAVLQRTHDRASLQPLHVSLFGDGRTTVRPYNRYTSRCSTTDARPSVPTTVTRRGIDIPAGFYSCSI